MVHGGCLLQEDSGLHGKSNGKDKLGSVLDVQCLCLDSLAGKSESLGVCLRN